MKAMSQGIGVVGLCDSDDKNLAQITWIEVVIRFISPTSSKALICSLVIFWIETTAIKRVVN